MLDLIPIVNRKNELLIEQWEQASVTLYVWSEKIRTINGNEKGLWYDYFLFIDTSRLQCKYLSCIDYSKILRMFDIKHYICINKQFNLFYESF